MTMTDARPDATHAPGYSETLPCAPESVRRARRLVSTALEEWTLGDFTDSGTLIVSELVANAVGHTRCRLVHVTVRRTEKTLVRIAVCDASRAVPTVGSPDGSSEVGRGLLLIDALSDRWGYYRHRRGKVVWAELRIKVREPGQ